MPTRAVPWGSAPTSGTRRRLRAFVLLAWVVSAAGARAAHADGETNAANVAAARRHYERAHADYVRGAYREAVAELEAAHALDPNAKDLVFNLAVVHEKLADIDEALQWFRLYATMDLTQEERDRGDAYIRRLEGAKRELEEKQRARAAQAPSPAPPPRPSTPVPERHDLLSGRIDAATLAAAGVAGLALLVGVTLGVKAQEDTPPHTFVTGRDGSYSDLVNRVDTAHREAVFADVSFAVAIAAGATAAVLYFARPAVKASLGATAASVFAAPLPGGGALGMQGPL